MIIYLLKGFPGLSEAEMEGQGFIEVRTTQCEANRVRGRLRDRQFLGSSLVGIGPRLAASAVIVAILWIGFFWVTGG